MKPRQRPEEHGLMTCTMVLLSGIAFLVLAGWGLGGYTGTARGADLQGSGWTVEGQGGSGTAQPAGQAQPVTAGQAQGQPEQLGDIPEDQPTFLDPDSIPDSVPIPMADWVFEVPVDVKNLPDEVQKLLVKAEVYVKKNKQRHFKIGTGGKIVDVRDGSFNGDVIVGVQYQENDQLPAALNYNTKWYRCILYLKGPGGDHDWYIPHNGIASPPWRRADPDQPFENWIWDYLP